MLKLMSDLNTLSVLCEVCDTSILNRMAVSFTLNSGLRLAHEVKNAMATLEVCDPRAAAYVDDANDDVMMVVSTTAVFVPQNFRGKTLSVREAVRLLIDENARMGVAESSEAFVTSGFSQSEAQPSESPSTRQVASADRPRFSEAKRQIVPSHDEDDESMSSEDDYL
jgi:hypothetical protein